MNPSTGQYTWILIMVSTPESYYRTLLLDPNYVQHCWIPI